MNPAEQTVSVRLTVAGQKAAQGGTLYVHGSGREIAFTGDVALDVPMADWNQVLRSTAPYGEPLFEIVAAAAPPAPTLVPPKAGKPAPAATAAAPAEGETK